MKSGFDAASKPPRSAGGGSCTYLPEVFTASKPLGFAGGGFCTYLPEVLTQRQNHFSFGTSTYNY